MFKEQSSRAMVRQQSPITEVVFLILLAGVLAITFRIVRPYLLAVLVGAILALLSSRLFEYLQRHRFKPKVAAVMTTLAVLLLLVGPVSAFVARTVQQGIALSQAITEKQGFSFKEFLDRLSEWAVLKDLVPNPEALDRQLLSWAQTLGKATTTGIIRIVAQVPQILLQVALALIGCFFFLLDGKKFLDWSVDKVPLDREVRRRLFDAFQNTVISVIWATLAAAGAQAFVIWWSFILLGVPFAFLAAGATFIFAWIPVVGSAPVWLSACFYLSAQGSVARTILMLLFGMITGVVDNFVRPWVLKGRGAMHPLVSLIAIFGGVKMFGLLGVFVGPIVMAIARSLLETWPDVERSLEG